MKDITWDKSLSVQIDEIDDDHRKLVDLFNRLNHSIEDGDTPELIEALLEELISCTVWHFRHEERLMLQHAYQGLEAHRTEHQELIDSARDLQRTFLQGGKSLNSEQIAFLEHWLTGHILGADMEMSAYLGELM